MRRTLHGLRGTIAQLASEGTRTIVVSGAYLTLVEADGRTSATLAINPLADDHAALAWPFALVAANHVHTESQVWDLQRGECVRAFHPESAITDVALTRDGTPWVAYERAGGVGRLGEARWERVLETGCARPRIAVDTTVDRVYVAANDRLITLDAGGAGLATSLLPGLEPTCLTAREGVVLAGGFGVVFVVQEGAEPLRVALRKSHVFPVSLGIAGERGLVVDNEGATLVFDLRDGSPISSIAGEGRGRAAILSDGRTVVRADNVGRVTLWSLGSGPRVDRVEAHARGVECVRPNGAGTLSASRDGTVAFWSAEAEAVDRWEVGEPLHTAAHGADTLAAGDSGVVHRRNGDPWATLPGPIYTLDLSGDRVVAAGYDGRLHIGDASGPTLAIDAHARPVLCARWSPDGERIASGGRDGILVIASLGQVVSRIDLESPVRCVDWAPDGTLAAGTEDGRVWRVSLDGGRKKAKLKGGWITALTWGPDGAWLAAGTYNGSLHRLSPTCEVLETLRRDERPVRSVVAVAAGRYTVTAGDAGMLYLDPFQSGGPIAEREAPAASVTALAWSRDGQTLFGAGNGERVVGWSVDGQRSSAASTPCEVWSLATDPGGGVWIAGCHRDIFLTKGDDKPRRRLTVTDAGVLGMRVSPDGLHGLSVGGPGGRLRLWDLKTRKEMKRRDLQDSSWQMMLFDKHDLVAWSPVGDTFAVGAPEGYVLLGSVDGPARSLRLHEKLVLGVAFSADGRTLLSACRGGLLVATDVATGEVRWRHEEAHGQGPYRTAEIASVDVSADGRVASLGGDPAVRLWRLQDGAPLGRIGGFATDPTTLAWQPDGDLLAVGAGSAEGFGAVTLLRP